MFAGDGRWTGAIPGPGRRMRSASTRSALAGQRQVASSQRREKTSAICVSKATISAERPGSEASWATK